VRILFAGSPALALPALEAVYGVAGELAVMSQPDKPVGRKRVLTPTAVSQWAKDRGLTLYRPVDHQGIHRDVSEFAPDLGITVAYGRILRAEVLAVPPLGWWNVHFSLLPRWRGAAPVQHALLAGDTDTGVSVFQLDEGMDTGPILAQVTHSMAGGITAGELLDELSRVGAELLATTLKQVQNNQNTPTPQIGNPTHAPKLDRGTGRIRATDTIEAAQRRYQATTPEPGCFVSWGGGEHTLLLLTAKALMDASSPADGGLYDLPDGLGIALRGGYVMAETVVQPGKKAMSATDWRRGLREEICIDE
jgi:methionyl-tRNA formyltransferase